MPITRSHTSYGDDLYQDRIVLFGGSPSTLSLLQLALIRSDNVLLIAARPDEVVSQHASRMGVEHRPAPDGTELKGAVTVLVADCRPEVEDRIVEAAQFRCIPVYVAERPQVLDFSVLDCLDRRASILAARTRQQDRGSL